MRLKLSYSLINLWQRGDTNGVIEALHGHWQEPNEAMKFGIQKHKEWENEVNATGCMPEVFGGKELENPKTEQYYKEQLADWLWLSGVVDLEYGKNGENIVDYKTGKGGAGAYANSLQAGCYSLLRPNAKRFTFKHFNQYDGKTSSSVVFLTDALRAESFDKIFSIACDIRATLETLGFEDFDNVDISSRKDKDYEQQRTIE